MPGQTVALSVYTPAQERVFYDLYKSHPAAYLKYYCAIMKYSNAGSLLPAPRSR